MARRRCDLSEVFLSKVSIPDFDMYEKTRLSHFRSAGHAIVTGKSGVFPTARPSCSFSFFHSGKMKSLYFYSMKPVPSRSGRAFGSVITRRDSGSEPKVRESALARLPMAWHRKSERNLSLTSSWVASRCWSAQRSVKSRSLFISPLTLSLSLPPDPTHCLHPSKDLRIAYKRKLLSDLPMLVWYDKTRT